MRSVFAEALYYTPKGVMPQPMAIELQRKDVKVDKVQRAVDIFRNKLSAVIEDVSKSLAVRVMQGRMMLVKSNTAIEVISQTIVNSLKANSFASFLIDEPRVEKLWNNEDRWIYIPPRALCFIYLTNFSNCLITLFKFNVYPWNRKKRST
ncbi:MAG: hypothetical protein LM590_04410 [Thermofilum sp.]|nr:hypothetical protein [Thermofilum sp.]